MIERLVRSSDFERVLRTRTRINSPHFAVHHVAASAWQRPTLPDSGELSTGPVNIDVQPVDDSSRPAPDRVWLGAVVPKRHARRSVTRTLLKRQIRAVVTDRVSGLAGGLWVVRLRAPFDKTRYPSAASDALRAVARAELEGLFDAALVRVPVGA